MVNIIALGNTGYPHRRFKKTQSEFSSIAGLHSLFFTDFVQTHHSLYLQLGFVGDVQDCDARFIFTRLS
jgi:hypothetical protein